MNILPADYNFSIKIRHWTPVRSGYYAGYTEQECAALFAAYRSFDPSDRTIAFLSFENQFASLGGLGTVMRQLPLRIQESGETVLCISPCYRSIPTTAAALADGRLKKIFGPVKVMLGDCKSRMTIYRNDEAGFPWYFVELSDRFSARNHPYDYADQDLLIEDSFAFCTSVPEVLRAINCTSNVLIHAQDWEAAVAGPAIRNAILDKKIKNARVLLTLHNSFDAAPQPAVVRRYLKRDMPGSTILQFAIPALDGPLTTVSTVFAQELHSDPLQAELFAPHLLYAFAANPPIGIENGLFARLNHALIEKATEAVATKSYGELMAGKEAIRQKWITTVLQKADSSMVGEIRFTGDPMRTPLFFMAGRLDLAQKGFDVFFSAFSRLKKGSAKLLFVPSVLDPSGQQLEFFREIVMKHSGDIALWPHRLSQKQYDLCLGAAHFVCLPSFYEPFGSATEGLCVGTPVFARATGGLINQVVSGMPCTLPGFYNNLLDQAGSEKSPTGILYREKSIPGNTAEQWAQLLALKPADRQASPLFNSMVDAAFDALEQACAIARSQARYAPMMAAGISSIGQFGWDRAVSKYRTVYDRACGVNF